MFNTKRWLKEGRKARPCNPMNNVFLVYINSDRMVNELRKAILLESPNHFIHFDHKDLFLWKYAIPNDDNLEAAFNALQFNGTDGITEQPSHAKDKAVTDLIEQFDKTVSKLLESDPPSKAAKSSGYISFQKHAEPIYDGRYPFHAKRIDTRAPPIQICNPVFGHFLDDIANKDLEVPTEVIRTTARLMNLASAMYENETQRKSTLENELMRAISTVTGNTSNLDRTSPDGMVIAEILVGDGSRSA